MANEEKKGGFFAGFRKGGLSGNATTDAKTPVSPAVQRQTPGVAPEPGPSSAIAGRQTPEVVAKPSSDPVNPEPVIDTVAAFNVLCNSLGDIGESQLKTLNLTLTMLSSSLNKIVDGLKPKG